MAWEEYDDRWKLIHSNVLAVDVNKPTAHPCSGDLAGNHRDAEPLIKAEKALWRDTERLARIEAVLDDPSLAVPLDELD